MINNHLRTTVSNIKAKTGYLDSLSKRRIDFGATEDGQTTESHKAVANISNTLKQIADRLIKREHDFALNSLDSDLFNSARPSKRSKVNRKIMKAGIVGFHQAAKRKLMQLKGNGSSSSASSNQAKVEAERQQKAHQLHVKHVKHVEKQKSARRLYAEQQRERARRQQNRRVHQRLSPQEINRRLIIQRQMEQDNQKGHQR